MTQGKNLSDIQSEIDKLNNQKKYLKRQIEGATKYEYRKKRARRLIETGALAEKYFDIENLTIPEREELFKVFSDFIKANKPSYLKK